MLMGAATDNYYWHYRWRCRECGTVEFWHRDPICQPCWKCGSTEPAEKIVTRRARVSFWKWEWQIRETSREKR